MIIDGKTLAKDILARAKARAEVLPRAPRVLAIVANETPATRSYLAIKGRFAAEAGCAFEIQKFPENVTTAELRSTVVSATADVIIVQLPLPSHINPREVCDAIPLQKDADVLSVSAREKFEHEKCLKDTGCLSTGCVSFKEKSVDTVCPHILPPVVAAIREVFAFGKVEPKGKKAVVIGEGWLVGKPSALWLAKQGAKVEVVTEKSGDFAAALRAADVIISGAGHPHLIKPDMIHQGGALIDAGTSESGGALAGDADPSCAAKCFLFTPVPGGVGPIAVACLFENAITLAEHQNKGE